MLNKKLKYIIPAVIFTIVVIILSSFSQKKSNDTKVLIKTSYGDIVLKLYNETPKHKANFLKLVEQGYYDSLLFHRVINNFMIQGGDPDSKQAPAGKSLGMGGPGYTIEAEFNKKFIHKKGALAAARLGGASNPEKRSSGSQFYIVQGTVMTIDMLQKVEEQRVAKRKSEIYQNFLQKEENKHFNDSISGARAANDRDAFMRIIASIDEILKNELKGLDSLKYTEEQKQVYTTIGGTPHLDFDYTVFGEVVEGLNVVDSIAAAQADKAARPFNDIVMSIELVK